MRGQAPDRELRSLISYRDRRSSPPAAPLPILMSGCQGLWTSRGSVRKRYRARSSYLDDADQPEDHQDDDDHADDSYAATHLNLPSSSQ